METHVLTRTVWVTGKGYGLKAGTKVTVVLSMDTHSLVDIPSENKTDVKVSNEALRKLAA